jgi:hypothetical protein
VAAADIACPTHGVLLLSGSGTTPVDRDPMVVDPVMLRLANTLEESAGDPLRLPAHLP